MFDEKGTTIIPCPLQAAGLSNGAYNEMPPGGRASLRMVQGGKN